MVANPKPFLITALFSLVAFAGCLDSQADLPVDDIVDPLLPVEVDITNTLGFTEFVVDAAVKFTNDLYEPTMEVSDSGVIYVTGHTIAVDTTGAPVFASYDDGETWTQLPFTRGLKMPEPIHGATPPVTDEIFLIAGEDGYLYGVDITAFAFPVNAWADDGREHIYYNPNAYDRAESTTAVCGGEDGNPVFDSAAASLNDRPWAAYGGGKLLMVNNPGGGPMQLGVMDVPMEQAYGIGGPVVGPEWNVCASTGGWIPGVPGMREDHYFSVPQLEGNHLNVVVGYADDVNSVNQLRVFNVTNFNPHGGTSNGGRVTFDDEGSMFVAIRNNTREDCREEIVGGFVPGTHNHVTRCYATTGQILVAASTDDGASFVNQTFAMPGETTSVWLDGNMAGPGALMTWSVWTENGTDWYTGHLFVGDDGAPVLRDVTLALAEGPRTSAHCMGAAVGPDGRAYFVLDYGGAPGDTPLRVVVQQDGPTLPITEVVTVEAGTQ